jgi:hypothetical protein
MLVAQDMKCCLCDSLLLDGYVVDHDHTCCPTRERTCGQCIRGLLCGACNTHLGYIERLPNFEEWLVTARKYLDRG